MPGIKVKENENFDVALRRFKRICEKAGIISIMRRREFYEKPTWVKKRKNAQARKRWLKKIQRDLTAPVRGAKTSRKGKGKGKSKRSSRDSDK